MIREIGSPLEVAREAIVTLRLGGRSYRISCTPQDLEDFAVGFAVTEGFANEAGDVRVLSVSEREVVVDVKPGDAELELRSSGCVGVYAEEIPKVTARESFNVEEVRKALGLLEIEEYRRTRGYHVAAVVCREGFVRRYDVGRHNALDKAVGAAILAGMDLARSFLVFSGRISRGIVVKCARAGIPLIASKAAILDSAIDACIRSGVAAVSFATNLAVVGKALKI